MEDAKETPNEMSVTEYRKPKVGTIREDGKRFWMAYKTSSGIKEFWVTEEKYGHYIGVKKARSKEWHMRQPLTVDKHLSAAQV